MIEYLAFLPIVFIILSLHIRGLFVIGSSLFIMIQAYSLFISGDMSQYYLYKEEILNVVIIIALNILGFIKKNKLDNQVRIISALVVLLTISKGIFTVVFTIEIFRLMTRPKVSNSETAKELTAFAVRCFFIFVLFLNVNIDLFLHENLSYSDLLLTENLVALSFIYLIENIMNFIKSLNGHDETLKKVILYIVFQVLVISYMSSLDTHSEHLLAYIQEYIFELSLFIILASYLFRRSLINYSLLYVGTIFTSIHIFQNSFYFFFVGLPVLILILIEQYKIEIGERYINYEKDLLPFSFSFLVFIIPFILGGEFTRSICAVTICTLLVLNFTNKFKKRSMLHG